MKWLEKALVRMRAWFVSRDEFEALQAELAEVHTVMDMLTARIVVLEDQLGFGSQANTKTEPNP